VRRAALVVTLTFAGLLSAAGCSSGSGARCLNPQPLPPFCGGGEPQPPPTAADVSNAGDAGTEPDGGDRVPEKGATDASHDAGQCRWPDSLDDGGPGACAVARAYVQCTYPSGAGCFCLNDDPTSCPECGPNTGAVCTSVCAPDEYAVSCGGPPRVLSDGGVGFDYQSAPASCTPAGATPGGNEYSCCPCR